MLEVVCLVSTRGWKTLEILVDYEVVAQMVQEKECGLAGLVSLSYVGQFRFQLGPHPMFMTIFSIFLSSFAWWLI